VNAPHYLVAFSEVKKGYLTNMGFMLQQMDLFFSANGIGCCWQGWPRPTKELRNNQELEFIIVLAFGLPKEKLHRESIDEFKRKPLSQITDANYFKEIIEAARLAPSPSQPWFFTNEGQTIHLFCRKTKGIKARMFGRLDKIEIGISACHLWVATLNSDKRIEFVVNTTGNIKTPAGYYYIISANIQ